jgi:L-histidine N-alpha-methyltransferase
MGPTDQSVKAGRIVVDLGLRDEEPSERLRGIREHLMRTPREIEPRYFYDNRGSELFERITQLPEYYQTRTERALLADIAAAVARRCECSTLVELGSGASAKTRVLLDAMLAQGCETYVPFDVSEGIVRRAAAELLETYPELRVHAVIGEFDQHLERVPREGRRLIIFLGGTIGNFTPEYAQRFLTQLAAVMDEGEYFLMGVDLIKDPARLEAAYNDREGVTAALNRNILRVLNKVADADFDPDGFHHRAFYDTAQHRVEMHLVATREHEVRLAALGMLLLFNEGDSIRSEISVKYDRKLVADLFEFTDFELVDWFTDPEELFGLALARRRPRTAKP